MTGMFARSSRRRVSVPAGVAGLLLVVAVPVVQADPLDPVLGPPVTTYPDLKPDGQNLGVEGFGEQPTLYFDTWSMNVGDVPLQVTAEVSEDQLNPTVSQCVSWTLDHICREQEQVGGFTFHTEHSHFHFEDFATYTLRRTLADGTPDYSDAGVVSISEKVSFCLIDSTTHDDPESNTTSPVPLYTVGACLAPAVMGISPGWADIYDSGLDGQQLSMAGVADGRYALVIDVDPADRLFETDDTNNRVVVTFTVTGLGTFFPVVSNVTRTWPSGGGGTPTTTTTSSTSSTTTSTTSTSTTSTTAPCRGGGGGGGGGGGNGNGGGGGGGGGGRKNC